MKKLTIAGLDLSPRSPGFVKFVLNELYEIESTDFLGFISYKNPKKIPNMKNIIPYHEDLDFYNRSSMFMEHIKKFLEGVDYAAIEDYSFSMVASGMITMLSEFCSLVKFHLFENGCKIRLITPTQNKQFATGKGNSEKPDMLEWFVKKGFDKLIDISELPKIPIHVRGKFVGLPNAKGVSPTSDIIDSFFLNYVLYNELLVRNKIKTLEELEKYEAHVLTHTTKNNKIPLIQQSFIEKIKISQEFPDRFET